MSETEQLNPVWWPRVWRSPALLALFGLLVVCFWWTFRWMLIRWDAVDSYYSHGWLILPISLALVYRKRKLLEAAHVRPSRWGLVVLGASLLLQVVGTAWRVGFMSGFALIGVLMGLVLALFGKQVLRIVLFPLVYLVFMVPLPLVANVSFQLKLAAARLAVGALDILGLPAVREGSFIHIPTGTVVVDDVCSGLKYVISLTAFGALYAHISSAGRWQKAVLFLVSIPISFAANVLRVTLMVLIGYFWGTAATQKWYLHGGFGFLLFAVAFVLLFITEALLLKVGGRKRGEGPRTLRIEDPKGRPRHAAARYGRVYGIALAAMLLASVLSTYLAWPRASVKATDVMGLVALQQGPWKGTDYKLDARTYAILGTHDVLSRVYSKGDEEPVQLVVVMAEQTRNRTHPPEQCYTGEGFLIQRGDDRTVNVPSPAGPRSLRVRELVLDRHDQKRVVWYFFKSGKHLTTSYWRHQVLLALSKLAHPDAADVLIRVDTGAPGGDLDAARGTLTDFLSHALPDLTKRLP